jgi:hypothetical protein
MFQSPLATPALAQSLPKWSFAGEIATLAAGRFTSGV